MRTKFASGPIVTTSNGQEFTALASTDTPSSRITHWCKSGLAYPEDASTPEELAQFLFSHPELLFGRTLLQLGERNTNKQIADNIAAAVGPKGSRLTDAAIASRINTALKHLAEEQGISFEDAKESFKKTRKPNGVLTRPDRLTKPRMQQDSGGDGISDAMSSQSDGGEAEEDVTADNAAEGEDGSDCDSELTESESEGEL